MRNCEGDQGNDGYKHGDLSYYLSLKGYRLKAHQQILRKNDYCITCLACKVIATQSFAAFRINYHWTLNNPLIECSASSNLTSMQL